MTTSIGNLNPYSYGGGASKLYVPVSKNAVLYSHFDHISGVAAKKGQDGVSISKIQILNTMIERLSAIKNEPVKSFTNISEETAEQLIKNYQSQIQHAVQTAPQFLAGAKPQAGEVFSFTA
ncbi:MAG: hypothetical protein HUK25_01310 [Treponema sp.]|mgnify:FL=1|nr:hypothetical protein [Treponema sp.]